MKEHKISLSTAVLLNMNIMIGSGILIGPGAIAAIAGNASFLAWPIVALFFLPLVLCTAQLGRMFPMGGGFYVYAKEGLNKTAGFMSGLLYVIGYTFAVAVEVLAVRKILLGVMQPNWFLNNVMLFNIVCVSVFVGLNLLSFKFFSRLLNSLTITKILPPLILVMLLPFILNWQFTVTTSELIALPNALPLAIFGFFGFEYCSSLAHLIENSEKNAPRAAVIGFLATAALYTLFHFGVLNLMGSGNLAESGASAFAQFLQLPIPFLKPFLMLLIPVASVLTVFAAGNGIMNANILMMESMAKENLFWNAEWLTKLNSNQRPWVAAVLQGLIVLVIVTLMPNINTVGGLCNLGIVAAFLLPFISLLVLQRRRGLIRSQPLTLLAIAATLGLLFYSWYQLDVTVAGRMISSLPIIVILVIGYLFFMMRDKHQDQVPPLMYH